MGVGRMYRDERHGDHQGSGCCEESKAVVVPGTEQNLLRIVRAQATPWRLNIDGTRAVLDLVIVGVGYLL